VSRAAGAEAPRRVRNYLALLRLLHRYLRPRTYVEIGVASGRSLARARPGTLCIGIDPSPNLRHSIPTAARIFELASDEFFSRHDLRQMLDGRPVDLAFIDGMHLFDFALRDFTHLERAAGRGSVITIHDCNPPSAEVATRDQPSGFWTGDVWKLILCLRQYRPDLRVAVVDVPPSGLAVVTNLDPTSAVLEEHYAQICQDLLDMPYGQMAESKQGKLNIVRPSWEQVRAMLPAPSERDQGDAPVAVPAGRRSTALPTLPPTAREAEPKIEPVAERVAAKHVLPMGTSASGQITLRAYPEPVLERVRGAAQLLDVRSGDPPIQRFRNLTFVPKFAALYDERGQRVLETCVRRNPGLRRIAHRPPEALEVPRGAPRIDRPVIYCGRLRAHWGHFLTETICRAWALRGAAMPPHAVLLFQNYPKRARGFVHRFFHHAGIDRSRFLDLDSVTVLSEVFVPYPSFSLGAESFRRHTALPESVAEAICTDTRRDTEQPVYLSRRLTRQQQGRPNREEQELEEALRRRGARVVAPETLPYEDQVRLFNRHSLFIGPIGSAFHSLLYALPGKALRTVVLGDTVSYYDPGYYPDYFMVDSLKGIRSTYIFDPVEANKPAGKATLDAKATVAALERLSII